MSAVYVREVDFPILSKDADEKHAYEITTDSANIGVLYAHEPYLSNCRLGIHVSISKSSRGRPQIVKDSDVAIVERLIAANGLRWPTDYERERFQGGPFKHTGLHIWEV